MEKRKTLTIELLSEFIEELKSFSLLLGVFNDEKDELAIARVFASRFFANLISLQRHFDSMDTLSATLIQRYNHEMLRDFFYIFGSPNSSEKVLEFFSYQERLAKNPTLRQWQNIKEGKNIKDFLPPWVTDKKTANEIYKTLSNLAHPNMISMRLHRGVERYQDIVIENAITLVINDISTCFIYEPFRKLVFGNKNSADFFEKMRQFQTRASNILFM